jgi:2-polyprenyl-3-methyl-5-hydroxy-6-metoxy-1,4-benzoquinol methylase
MELVQREKCVLTEEFDLEMILKIEKFPISMYTVDEHDTEDQDLKVDMQWWISKGTGSVQLAPLIPLDLLYKKSHSSGAVGKTWEQHHAEFSDFISSFEVKRVLEIGAGHGILAQRFVHAHPEAQYYIVEPNLPSWSHERVKFYQGMFDANFAIDQDVDAVVHSHTFEHVYEPKEFLGNVAKFLHEGQWHIFSLPRLEVWLDKGYSNALHFEHTLYLTEANIDYLMKSSGLEVVCKKYFLEDHSVFYATRKCFAVVDTAVVPRDYYVNLSKFLRWVDSTKQYVNCINDKIAGYKSGHIYIFGGHIFTQFLIGFGLHTAAISCILDNDPAKAGRRLYGTSLMVRLPDPELRDLSGAAVILRTGAYNQEIKQGILDNVNPNVVFWE